MRFHDSMRVTQPLAAYGLRREHLERRLYLRDEQGRILSGFRAVLAIWARLPEYRRLARVFSWPPLRARLRNALRPRRRTRTRVLGARPPDRSSEMNEFSALITVIAISLVLSSATVFAIYQPLHQLLEAVCPLGFTAEFWTRAAVTVIYLLPLWVVLVFGLPDLQRLEYVSAGESRAARWPRRRSRWWRSSSRRACGSPACAPPSSYDLTAAGALDVYTRTFLNCQGSVLSRSSGNSRSRSCSGVQSV